MATQKNYHRIEKAISYLIANADHQPSLQQLASHLNLSQHHLHRLFTEYVGTTPKNFLQAITLENAKHLIRDSSTLHTSEHIGLSSSSRLHDHFVTLEAVTPGEFQTQGNNMLFNWGIEESVFGQVFLCWTKRGIHQLFFIDSDGREELTQLQNDWPKAEFIHNSQKAKQLIHTIFQKLTDTKKSDKPLSLWVKGTNFQMNVWKALLHIPSGMVTHYGAIANSIDKPKAHRAVGTAVGKNPISFIIPCHRVIRQTGEIGNYRWGTPRKKVMLVIENRRSCQLSETGS